MLRQARLSVVPRRCRGRNALVMAVTLALANTLPGPLAGQVHIDGHHGGAAPPAGSAILDVVHRPEDHAVLLRLGPFHLPARGNTMRLSPARSFAMPITGWLTEFRTRVIDSEGRDLPREVLHHINLVRPDRRELFMPVMQRLAAAGQETGRVRLPFPLGVPVEAGDTVIVAAMVHNPTDEPLEVVLETRLRYDPVGWPGRVDVQPFFLDLHQPPAPASFDLPPGRSVFTWDGAPAIDVRVLALGGHIHKYGRALRLMELSDDGPPRLLWESEPVAGPDGRIEKIPRETFLLNMGLPLSSERRYRLVVVYDNPTRDTIRAGGMAEVAGIAWPSTAWPAPDPNNPVFLADYRSFTRHSPELQPSSGEGGT